MYMRGCVNCENNDQLDINYNDFIEDVASFYERLARREQYPTVDPEFSDEHLSVAAIIPLRDKHPENNEHQAPLRPRAELVSSAIIPPG